MKCKFITRSLLLIGTLLMVPPSTHGEITIGDVAGTAWTIGNAIVGETTLTPAYGIKSYTWRVKSITPSDTETALRKVHRDLLGQYFYYSKNESSSGATTISTDPFPVDSMNKLNMTCQQVANGSVIETDITLETHTEVVWMAQVQKTGLWPDDGPWTVWLKTGGYKTGCSNPTPVPDYYYWINASIGQSGSQTVSLGTPNAILNYPFYLANQFYK